MVDSNGDWGERCNSRNNHHDNPGMMAAEQTKYKKHEAQYSHTGYSFVAFVCSCFGALGPSAIRYMWVLAMLELRQHVALCNLQGMDPLEDSERAQYTARCFRSSSSGVAAAMAKATLMRLAGSLSIPAIAPVYRQLLAHNLRGASDLRDLRQAPRVPCARSFPPLPISLLPVLLAVLLPLISCIPLQFPLPPRLPSSP